MNQNITKPKSGYKLVKNYFKKTFEIPEDWQYVRYKDVLIEKESPINFNDDEYYPLITIKRRNEGLMLRSTLQGKEIETKNLFSVDVGDFIISKMQIIHGACGSVPKSLSNAKISGSYIRFKSKDILDLKYFNFFSITPLFYQHTFISSVGSNLEKMNFNKKHWLNHSFPLPPLKQQKKITSILSNVDSRLNQTKKIIEQTERFKKGMIKQLLTKGIGHKKFKKVKWYFGKEIEIPEKWKLGKLKDYSLKIGSGVTPEGGSEVYKESGIPLIRSQNVHFDELYLDNVAYIDKKTHDEMKITKLQSFDVLLNITGASIGRCTYVPENFGEGNVNQHVCIIRLKKDIHYGFLTMFLSTYLMQSRINSIQAGLSRQGLNFKDIGNFLIIIPSITEQEKIASIYSKINDRLILIKKYKFNLEALKKGLMQKLLTGEIRVKA